MIERLKQASWWFWLNVALSVMNLSLFVFSPRHSDFSFWVAVFCACAAAFRWRVDSRMIEVDEQLATIFERKMKDKDGLPK